MIVLIVQFKSQSQFLNLQHILERRITSHVKHKPTCRSHARHNFIKHISHFRSYICHLGCDFIYLRSRFVEVKPNEWLLVIRDGKMVKSGIGLKAYLGLTDSYVRFPYKVERVTFTANNITKEMQGVIITGFTFWSVFREGDGPFRCYKYMEGGDANRNVNAICESALRNLITNSTLSEVLRNRKHLRDNMVNDLKDQFKGWGIWLETIEITVVKISSDRLFKDLQAEFRQETQMKAQQIELQSQEKINQIRQISELKMAESAQLNQTKKLTTTNNQKIKRQQQQGQYQNQKNQLEIARMARQSKLEIQKMKNSLLQEQQRLKNEQLISKMKQDFDLEYERKRLALEKQHNDVTLHKYQIDSTERIYSRLGIQEIKIHQFTGDSKTTLASLLPQVGYLASQINSAN